MLRETTFLIGGALTVGLGVALAGGLFWAGAGAEYSDAWLASAMAMGLGGFFVYVARDEHRDRLEFLARVEKDPAEKSGPR